MTMGTVLFCHKARCQIRTVPACPCLFKLWQDNQINVWDLEQAVHNFHKGAARELYKHYTMLKPAEALPYALFKNIITYEELPVEVVEEMKMIVSILYNYDRNGQEFFDETE